MVKSNLLTMIKSLIIIFVFFYSNLNSESYVKAGDSLIWDSENKSYKANGDVVFKNEKFIAYSDEMIAYYIEKDNEEVFKAGEIPKLDSNALPHWELASKYDLIDFELGNKI